jgi:hypothetical protein
VPQAGSQAGVTAAGWGTLRGGSVLGLGSAVAGEDVLKGGGTMEVGSTLEGAEGSAFEGSGAEGSALGGSRLEEGAARARAFAPADYASGLARLPDLSPPAYRSVCMHARFPFEAPMRSICPCSLGRRFFRPRFTPIHLAVSVHDF